MAHDEIDRDLFAHGIADGREGAAEGIERGHSLAVEPQLLDQLAKLIADWIRPILVRVIEAVPKWCMIRGSGKSAPMPYYTG